MYSKKQSSATTNDCFLSNKKTYNDTAATAKLTNILCNFDYEFFLCRNVQAFFLSFKHFVFDS